MKGGRISRVLRLACCVLGATFFVLAGPRVCAAQSADKLITAFVRASGGAKAMKKLRSSNWQGTAKAQGEAESGEFTLLTSAPGEFYREFVFGAEQFTEACNTSSCWSENGTDNLYTLFGAMEKREQATGKYLNFALADYKRLKIRATVAGTENVDGRVADVVVLQIPPGETRCVYFDRATHLIVKEIIEPAEAPAAEEKPAGALAKTSSAGSLGAEEEISYADYRPVQGIMEPFQMNIRRGAQAFKIAVVSISFNTSVNASAFAFPSLSRKPLPHIPALLKAVDANQKKIDEIQKDYACMKREKEEKVDGRGQVTKRKVTVYQISYIKGHEVARKIEVDGRPLSEAEQQKEDARIQKEVARYNKEAAEPKKKSDDDVGISDFLKVDRFTNPRWERFRGQDVVVFDFGPNPDYNPKKLAEKVIYDLVGTVWIDPRARDVVRLEARFDKSFKVGGGMVASLQPGSAFQFEQSLINNEVWLPSYDEVHVGAKIFVFKKLRVDVVDRYYGYQKFHVSTEEKVGQLKQQ